jgi:hypothetical protein
VGMFLMSLVPPIMSYGRLAMEAHCERVEARV